MYELYLTHEHVCAVWVCVYMCTFLLHPWTRVPCGGVHMCVLIRSGSVVTNTAAEIMAITRRSTCAARGWGNTSFILFLLMNRTFVLPFSCLDASLDRSKTSKTTTDEVYEDEKHGSHSRACWASFQKSSLLTRICFSNTDRAPVAETGSIYSYSTVNWWKEAVTAAWLFQVTHSNFQVKI